MLPGHAKQCRAMQGRAEHGRAEQSRTKQGRAITENILFSLKRTKSQLTCLSQGLVKIQNMKKRILTEKIT